MQQTQLDKRAINETGNRYGMLTVIEASDRRSPLDKDRLQQWLCRCDCGKEVIIRGSALRRGETTNCGCESRKRIGRGQAIDITNHQFGMLTAIRNTWTSNERGFIWECVCVCGNHCLVPAKNLTSHNTGNCGCIKKPKSESVYLERHYYDYKSKAIKRGKIFELTLGEFISLVKRNCFYCGETPAPMSGHRSRLVCNGIDRVNNKIGYTIANCVPCCGRCNHMKFVLKTEQFLEHIKKIYFFQIFKNKS